MKNPFLSSIAFFWKGINVLGEFFHVLLLYNNLLKEDIDKTGKLYKIIQVMLDILKFKW